MSVQVQASFKKDQKHLDGLDHVRKQLIDEPLTPRVIVAVIDVAQITHDVLDGSDTPKIRFRQVEVPEGVDAMKVVDILNRTYEKRTGRQDSQATLFDEWDPGAPSDTAAAEHREAAIQDAPLLDVPDAEDEDPRTAEEIMAERAEAKAAVPGVGEVEDLGDPAENRDGEPDGVPWPGDVEFTPPASVVDPDVSSDPDSRRGRRGRK